jgi:hypothetical protein
VDNLDPDAWKLNRDLQDVCQVEGGRSGISIFVNVTAALVAG